MPLMDIIAATPLFAIFAIAADGLFDAITPRRC
jgi:hypothetical protein